MRFLLVEDDPTTEDLLACLLRMERHEVDVAPTTKAAMAALACNKYDVAMIDWVLAGETGMTALRKAVDVGVPVVVLATAAPPGMIPETLLLEMVGNRVRMLQKPFDLRQIYKAIGLENETRLDV